MNQYFRPERAPVGSIVRTAKGIRGMVVVLAAVIGAWAIAGSMPPTHAMTAAPGAFSPTTQDSSPLGGSEDRAGHRNASGTTAQTATVPNMPDNLSAAWRGGEIFLYWGAPKSNGGSPITRYEYRYTAGSEPLPDSWTSAALDLAVAVGGLTNGVAHTFEVRAVNIIGGGEAASLRAMPLAAREGDIRITKGEDCQGLPEVLVEGAWGLICADEFTDRSARVGCRQLGFAGGTWHKNNGSIVPTQDIPARMENVTCGGSEGRLSDCPQEPDLQFVSCGLPDHQVLLDCDTSSLGPPKNVTFIAGEPQGTLVWNAPARHGGASIIRYEYRHRLANEEFGNWTDAGRNLMALVPNPTEGSAYLYEVRAINAAGAWEANKYLSQPEPIPKNVLLNSSNYPQVKAISGFTLTGSATPSKFVVLDEDAVVRLSDYDEDRFLIQADVWAEDVESVELELSWLTFESPDDPPEGHRRSTTIATVDNDAPWQLGDFGLSLRAGEYHLKATAYGADDKEGEPLDRLSVSFVVFEHALGTPEHLSANWLDGEVTLSWDPPAGAEADLITGYQYRSQPEGGQFTEWADAGAELTATIPLVEDGAAYTYEVRAVSPPSLGESVRLVTPYAPGPLGEFSAVVEEGPPRLEWTPPVHNGGASIARYEYRYRTGDGEFGPWTDAGPNLAFAAPDVDVPAGPNLAMTIPDLEDGVGYLVEMRAVNGFGSSPAELAGIVTSGFTVQSYDDKPSFPLYSGTIIDLAEYFLDEFSIIADAFDDSLVGSMELKLTGPVSHTQQDNGAPWTLFGGGGPGRLQLSTKRFLAGNYRLSATSYSEPGLKGAKLETRRVEFTAAEMPDAPRDLNAHWADGSLELSWRPPENSSRSDLTGYQYRYREGDGPFTAWSATARFISATIPNVAEGAVNTYEARSVNELGTGEVASLTTPAAPGKPPDLAVVPRQRPGDSGVGSRAQRGRDRYRLRVRTPRVERELRTVERCRNGAHHNGSRPG